MLGMEEMSPEKKAMKKEALRELVKKMYGLMMKKPESEAPQEEGAEAQLLEALKSDKDSEVAEEKAESPEEMAQEALAGDKAEQDEGDKEIDLKSYLGGKKPPVKKARASMTVISLGMGKPSAKAPEVMIKKKK